MPKSFIFVSSLIPMLAFYFIRIGACGIFVFLSTCFLGFILTMWSQKIILKGASEKIKIVTLEDKSGDIIFTLLSYVLIPAEYGFTVAFLYILFVSFAFFYSNIYFSNIFIALIGVRCYSVSIETGENLLLLIKGDPPSLNDRSKVFQVFKVSNNIYLLSNKK